MTKKVFITGSEGLIGRPLVVNLEARGHEVARFDRKLDGRMDARWMSAVSQAMAGCDTVVHLAAIAWPHPAMAWKDFWEQNCLAVQSVAACAEANGVSRFIFTSSTAYYGFEANVPLDKSQPKSERAMHTKQYLRPDDFDKATPSAVSYIQSKVIDENILAVYGMKKVFEVAILRLCPVRGDPYLGLNVYNENVTPALTRLVETDRELWYEVFNFANPSVELIDTSKWDKFWGDEWQYL